MRPAIADAGSTLDGLTWPALAVILFAALVAVIGYVIWLEQHDQRPPTHQCGYVVSDDGDIVCAVCGRDMSGELEEMPADMRARILDAVAVGHQRMTCRHNYRPVRSESAGVTWQCDACGDETVAGGQP